MTTQIRQDFIAIKHRRDNGIPNTDHLENVTLQEAVRWATKDAHVYRDPILFPCDWQGYRTGPDIALEQAGC